MGSLILSLECIREPFVKRVPLAVSLSRGPLNINSSQSVERERRATNSSSTYCQNGKMKARRKYSCAKQRNVDILFFAGLGNGCESRKSLVRGGEQGQFGDGTSGNGYGM